MCGQKSEIKLYFINLELDCNKLNFVILTITNKLKIHVKNF